MFAAPRALLREISLNQPSLDPGFEPELSRDSLELHFRKMAEYPLLDHDGEVALARRLEKADRAITRALLRSPEGREELREVVRALRGHELRVEDVERNPSGDDVPARLERAIAAAERAAAEPKARERASTRARATGREVRLHPRTVRRVERELRLRSPRSADLRRTIGEVEELLEQVDAATEEFIHANLRIVVTFARRYRGMPLVDLIQEGNIGLLRAIDKFDHRRGLRFSTYAAWWIRHALTRALADQGKMIRLPVHLTGAVLRVRRAQDRIQRETGRLPGIDELAARTGLPSAQVRRALDVVAQPVSLDVPVGGGQDAELGDFVVDPSASSADETFAQKELYADAHDLLATLPEREAEVLRLRFGVGGGSQRTLEEVGAKLALSRERARQIERDALRKLRAVSEKRRLRAHLEG